MGVSWLDVIVSLLKFEGFTSEKFSRKVIRIVTYPFFLVLTIGVCIWFIVMMIIVAFKSR